MPPRKPARPVRASSKKASPAAPSSLVHIGSAGAALSRNQQEFNKLTARIEKLRKEVASKEAQLNEALTQYGAEIHPLRQTIAQHKRDLLLLLWPHFTKDKLSGGKRATFRKLLKDLLYVAVNDTGEEASEQLKIIFRTLEGETLEAAEKRDEQELREEMKEMFGEHDIDIDLDDDNLSEEETIRRITEAKQRMQEKWERDQEAKERKRATRPKTAKQLEREALQKQAEAMKNKDLQTLYRQLAKLFHPDLEQDPDRRIEKEALMQELTRAYEAKDLHALLRLELQWVQGEEAHLSKLTDEKLKVYLELLRAQAKELESEKWSVAYRPQYRPLVDEYGPRELTYPQKTIRTHKEELQNIEYVFRRNVEEMQVPNPSRAIKEMIADYEAVNQQKDFEEEMMMQMMQAMMGGKGFR